jgi:hypothetical protein
MWGGFFLKSIRDHGGRDGRKFEAIFYFIQTDAIAHGLVVKQNRALGSSRLQGIGSRNISGAGARIRRRDVVRPWSLTRTDRTMISVRTPKTAGAESQDENQADGLRKLHDLPPMMNGFFCPS